MSVTDLKASVEFYSEALGVRLQNTPDTMQAEDASLGFSTPSNSAVLAFPNGYLKLSEYDRSDFSPPPVLPVKGPGITHVCYQSPTSEDIYQRLINGGATTVSRGEQPVHLLGQGVYYAYARDHDGIMYETEHLDHAPFEGPIWFSHAGVGISRS
jgi:catechol 2,3-dioxygenase-like lactoylglutathione lyase family enzyme